MDTADAVPEENKKRSVVSKRKKQLKTTLKKDKACKMLHEGKANGQEISDQQRKFFGAVCSSPPARKGK